MPVTITTIGASDQITDSRGVINTNFSNVKTAVETLETTVDGLGTPATTVHLGLQTSVPTVDTLTWVNQGGASATDHDFGFSLRCPSQSSDNIHMLTTPLTSGYNFVVGCIGTLFPANYAGVGIVMRNSTNGTIILYSIGNDGVLAISRWTNATTFSSTPVNLNLHCNGKPMFLRVTDATGSRVFSYSFDGREFVDCHTEANNTHVGAPGAGNNDQIGVAVNTNNGSAANAVLSVFRFALDGIPG